MRHLSLMFTVILHFSAAVALKDENSLDARILEVLKGSPRKGPVPPVRVALLLCRRSGWENVNRDLIKAAGTPSLLFVSANPKNWTAVLHDALNSYDDHLVSFVLDMGCPGAMDLLQKADDRKMFRSPYRWLIIYPTSNMTSMSSEMCADQAEVVLGNLAILLDSEVISMCRYGEDGQYGLLIEWYRYIFHEHPFIGELGSWQGGPESTRIKWTERSLKPLAVRRSNLMGLTVSCGFVLRYNESLLHLMDGVDTRKDTVTKFFYPIFTNTAEMLNGTFTAKWTDSWGFPVNGTWNGMVGMQLRGEVDLSGIPALMEHVRNTVLSFVSFRMPIEGIFLFRAAPMSYEANLFALPFPRSLWAAAGGLIFVCVFILYLVLTAEDIMDDERPSTATTTIDSVRIQPLNQEKPKQFLDLEPSEEVNKDNARDVTLMPSEAISGDGIQAKARLHGSWSDVVLVVFGAVCQQGSPVEARRIPGRIVSISMLIAVIFLFTSYTASIVVLLQSTSDNIKTFEDLWKSRMPCGAEDVGYNKYLFTQLQGEDRLGILKKIASKNKMTPSGDNYMTLEAGMERLRKEYFAFQALSTSMFPIISETWLEHEKCALREIRNFYYPQHPYVSTSKFNPIVEMFRITLRKMHERGIRSREKDRIVTPKPKCINQGSNFNSVSIIDIFFPMVVLPSGVLISLLVFGMEHIAAYRLRRVVAARNEKMH